MHFTTTAAAAILAFASSALSAPYNSPRTEQTPAPALSLTQQLFLADT